MTTLDYAGKYLQKYEWQHYPLLTRLREWLPTSHALILVPPGAEQFADVSFYQSAMDWQVYRQHARAAILRLGQNIWIDTELEYNYSEARQQGLVLGGYWFYDDRVSPAQQLAVIKQAMQGKHFEMELFVDWEREYGGPYTGLKNVVALMQGLEAARIPVKAVGTYTGYYWFKEHSSAITHPAEYAYLKSHPLWLAWYALASLIQVPAPWSDWAHWQFGTPQVEWGQPTVELDMNKANATGPEFENKYMGAVVPPPTQGDNMKGLMKVGYTVNVRNRLTAAIVAALRAGDAVYGTVTKEGTREYIYFEKIYRADGTIELWPNCKAVTGDGVSVYYMAITAESEPVPPVVVLPSIFITHTFNDTLVVTDPAGKITTYTATWTTPNVEYKPVP